MSTYVPAKAYLRLIRQADLFQPLVTTVTYDGNEPPSPLFYKAELNETTLILSGYAVTLQPEHPENCLTKVAPEEAFVSAREFWFCEASAIYVDHRLNPDAEKQAEKTFGRLCWAASTQRKTKFDEFYVDLNRRVISVAFSLELIRSMADAADKKENAKVTLTSTIPDSILDRAPVGLKPTTGV
jgi:hypothetical protein